MVLYCTFNTFILENFGCYESNLENAIFKDFITKQYIQEKVEHQLAEALTDMTSGDLYSGVDHIKIIVKQQTAHIEIGINNC